MFLRAWHQWLKFSKSNRSSRRRSMRSFPAEHLESRCLLAAAMAVPSNPGANPILTVSGSTSLTISDDGTNLTYQLGAGTATPFNLTTSLSGLSSLTIRDSSLSNHTAILLTVGGGLSSSFRVIVNGNGGDDEIDASGCEFSVVLNGGSGKDRLTGGSMNDTLNGSTNDDILIGGDGDDDIDGGSGNDEISGDGGDDLCLGSTGNDEISGGADNDNVNGQAGDDVVVGDEGNDYVYGGAGRDFVDGGDGIDIVKGQGGRDTITGSMEEAINELNEFGSFGNDTWRGNYSKPSPPSRGSPYLYPGDTKFEYESY